LTLQWGVWYGGIVEFGSLVMNTLVLGYYFKVIDWIIDHLEYLAAVASLDEFRSPEKRVLQ
jgi:hypothetical protein